MEKFALKALLAPVVATCARVSRRRRKSKVSWASLLLNIQDSELSTRTDSFQFGRPFRRNAADVGATGSPCETGGER